MFKYLCLFLALLAPAPVFAAMEYNAKLDSKGCHICLYNCPQQGLDFAEYHCHYSDGRTPDLDHPRNRRSRKRTTTYAIEHRNDKSPFEISTIRNEFERPQKSRNKRLRASRSTFENLTNVRNGKLWRGRAQLDRTTRGYQRGDRAPDAFRNRNGDTEKVQVLQVVNPKTIEVRMPEGEFAIVRIVGIEAPKRTRQGMQNECYADQSAIFAQRLLARRAVDLFQIYAVDRDSEDGLTYAYVSLNGEDVGARMIAEGAAYSADYQHQKLLEYDQLEDAAKTADRGLWGSCIGR